MDVIVKNLTKFYGQQKAVDNLSFEVKTGEILGFLGPNGAGKTTTMKAIAGCLTPTEGTIAIGRYNVAENADKVRQPIGYLPEHNPLYTDMFVIDYLRYMARLQRIRAAKINDRILEMVNVCGLEGEKHKRISELSKGYRQRVGLAQALIHDPQVLILDEPTTGLDQPDCRNPRAHPPHRAREDNNFQLTHTVGSGSHLRPHYDYKPRPHSGRRHGSPAAQGRAGRTDGGGHH